MSDETLRAAALAAVERLQSDGSVWIKPDIGLLQMRAGRALDFISAANPAVVLDLLDRLAAAEAAVDRAERLVEIWTHMQSTLRYGQALQEALSGLRATESTEVDSGSTGHAEGAQIACTAVCPDGTSNDPCWPTCTTNEERSA